MWKTELYPASDPCYLACSATCIAATSASCELPHIPVAWSIWTSAAPLGLAELWSSEENWKAHCMLRGVSSAAQLGLPIWKHQEQLCIVWRSKCAMWYNDRKITMFTKNNSNLNSMKSNLVNEKLCLIFYIQLSISFWNTLMWILGHLYKVLENNWIMH